MITVSSNISKNNSAAISISNVFTGKKLESLMSQKATASLFFSIPSASAGSYYAHMASGDSTSHANEDEARRQCYINEAQEKFLELARSEYFEYGYTPPSEEYLLKFAKKYPGLVGELVQRIYCAELANSVVILALLNAIASLNYEVIQPYGQILAVAALSNPAAEVKEAAIRTFETWGNADGARILASADCPWDWLDDYRKQVIADLGG